MKKILFTTPNFKTAGSGKVIFDLVNGLRNDFIVEIAVLSEGGFLYDELKKLGVKIHVVKFAQKAKPYSTLLYRLIPMIRFLKDNNIDLIHSWHYNDDWTEVLAARIAGVKYVYTKKNMNWGGKDWLIRSRLSNRVIIINSDMGKMFFPNWRNTRFLPLGIDISAYRPLPLNNEVYKEQLQGSEFIIISVANLVPVKNIELVILALSLIPHRNFKYFLVGNCDSKYQITLDNVIKEKGLTENVIFLGQQNDVRPFLSGCELFIISSIKEGQPIAPIEAMACQRLVAGSEIPGIKDILADFPEFLFETNNAEELADVIINVMSMSNEKRNQIASEMRQKVEKSYNMERFIEAHKELYNTL